MTLTWHALLYVFNTAINKLMLAVIMVDPLYLFYLLMVLVAIQVCSERFDICTMYIVRSFIHIYVAVTD